jgi:superfamily II DNA or RNA helicase
LHGERPVVEAGDPPRSGSTALPIAAVNVQDDPFVRRVALMPDPIPVDLARTFDAATLERACDYVDRVELVEVGRRGVVAVVARADGRRYRVRIDPPHRAGEPAWTDCSCPVGVRCKHAAAVMIHLAVVGPPSDAEPGFDPQLPPQLAERYTIAHSELPTAWRRWLAVARRGEPGSPPAIEIVSYTLAFDDDAPRLQASRRRVGRNGALLKPRPIEWRQLLVASGLDLTRQDRLLAGLMSAVDEPSTAGDPLRGEPGEQALLWALETGRLYLADEPSRSLRLGEPRPLDLGWTLAPDGNQRFGIRDAEGLRVFLLERLWCLDPAALVLAPVQSELAPADAARLLQAPPIAPAHRVEVRQALSGLPGLGSRLPLPDSEPLETSRVAPRFVARVIQRELPDPDAPHRAQRNEQPVVELFAEYRQQRTPLDGGRELVHGYSEGRLCAYERDGGLERRLMAAVDQALGAPPDPSRPHLRKLAGPGGYLDAIADGVERLRNALDGFDARIEFDAEFPFELVSTDDALELEVDDGDDNQWFSTSLGIEVDGERVDLVPLVIGAVDNLAAHGGRLPEGDFRLFLRLDERRVIGVPGARLRPLLELLLQWAAPRERVGRDGALQLRRFEAASLADATGHWRLSPATRELAERLAGFRGLQPVAAPAALATELRDYQLHGLAWLQFLREFGFGGVLADDMGLGKTVQLLAHLLVEQAAGRLDRPCLVVAPTSVIFNWRNEAARFAPTLRVLLLHGPQRAVDFERIAEHDLVLTSYALLPRDDAVLVAQPWHVVVLDEAQAVKNAKARASQTARRLQARQRLALTGTPVENHLGELWAQFDFLMPGLLGNERQFRRLFRSPIEKHADRERQAALNRRIAPFLLRRTKDGVVRELPPKTEMVHSIELGDSQRDLYETLRAAMQSKVYAALQKRGLAQSRIDILDALLKLRQACCDPRLVKLAGAARARSSAKLDALLAMLDELLEEGRRVLVFSQFTSMLDLIEAELQRRRWSWVRLSGESKSRGELVERFQSGEVPLFLLSLKAGGVGLNLTAADTVIHYDPWWNPAAEDQATDRAYRIGQDKPVFVYKLIAQGTVEERMQAMQARKRALAGALYDDAGAASAQFDADDLAELFAPIG